MIYAAGILERRFIKIGFAEDVRQRLLELQVGNPYQISEVMSVEGTLRQEQALHSALTSRFGILHVPRPPNEWYPGKLPFMKDLLEELKSGVVNAIAFADDINRSKTGREKYYMGGLQQERKRGWNYDPVFKWPTY